MKEGENGGSIRKPVPIAHGFRKSFTTFAADINCANVVLCVGTTRDDRMAGGLRMDGNQGNDQMAGTATTGSDVICGGAGNDKVTGGASVDLVIGDHDTVVNPFCPSTGGSTGSDILIGGDGDDRIFHGDRHVTIADSKKSDGHRDIIDCGGDGDDVATINISVDHDIATNCETVNAG